MTHPNPAAAPQRPGLISRLSFEPADLWQQLSDYSFQMKADAVADKAYRDAYPLGHRHTYIETAYRLAAGAAQAAVNNLLARPGLDALRDAAVAAARAASSMPVYQWPAAPPADQNTLDAAAAEANTNLAEPWRPVTAAAWQRGLHDGTNAGAVRATTDIRGSLQIYLDSGLPQDPQVDGQPWLTWVNNLLAEAHKDATAHAAPPGMGALATRTAARLASQGQAPSAAARTAGGRAARPRQSSGTAPDSAGRARSR